MSESLPSPISVQEERNRLRRVQRIARELGFEGRVEYRHVLSGAGGAQYGIGSSESLDLLVVFAEAFQRDENPEDFSLEAIIAHERGHQLIVRHPRFAAFSARGISLVSEEVLASLIGSLIVEGENDQQSLYYKALFEIVGRGVDPKDALRLIQELRSLLEKML
jgi:hypothetical protein